MLVVLLLTIITLGMLSNIPRINNDPNTVRPLLTNTPSEGEQSRVLEVDFGTDPFWISQANFEIEDCTGAILIIEGAECHDLPMNVIEHTVPLPLLYYLYLLPGSVVNITIEDTVIDSELQVWILNSEGWLQTDLGRNLGSCDDPPTGSSCFLAQNFTGQTIKHEIEKADFYFYSANRLSLDVGFTYVAKEYSLTAIRELYSPKETAIIRDRSHTVTISSAFDFQRRKCVVLSSSCPNTQSHPVTIENVKRRMDVLIFPGVVGVIVMLVAISEIGVCITWRMWPKLKKTYWNNVAVGTL